MVVSKSAQARIWGSWPGSVKLARGGFGAKHGLRHRVTTAGTRASSFSARRSRAVLTDRLLPTSFSEKRPYAFKICACGIMVQGIIVHSAPTIKRRSATRLGQIVAAVVLFEEARLNDQDVFAPRHHPTVMRI